MTGDVTAEDGPPPVVVVLAKLMLWREALSDFHADRQLADEVLTADGWRVERDPAFEGGVAWRLDGGRGLPTLSVSEALRPHPLNDLNVAIGVVPFGCSWSIHAEAGSRAVARVWRWADRLNSQQGVAERPTVALLIAAMLVKRADLARERAP